MKFTFQPESRPLDGFTLKRAIARGGFGEVYYALTDAGKEVALKLLQQNLDVELRGVQQCLNLKHPHLVTLFDIKTDRDGDSWVVMEFISGPTLEQSLARNPQGLPLDQVVRWMEGITRGLEFLHDRGIVHRDLKPANLFWDQGIVKVGDVGLSKFITPSRRSAHTESVGTVYYMAPEVAYGKYGYEVDLYSVGVMLFEMLTGHVPFDGESTAEIMMKHLSQPPNLATLPQPFRPLVQQLLEKDPKHRPTSLSQIWKQFLQGVRELDQQAAASTSGLNPTRGEAPTQVWNPADPAPAPAPGNPPLPPNPTFPASPTGTHARVPQSLAEDFGSIWGNPASRIGLIALAIAGIIALGFAAPILVPLAITATVCYVGFRPFREQVRAHWGRRREYAHRAVRTWKDRWTPIGSDGLPQAADAASLKLTASEKWHLFWKSFFWFLKYTLLGIAATALLCVVVGDDDFMALAPFISIMLVPLGIGKRVSMERELIAKRLQAAQKLQAAPGAGPDSAPVPPLNAAPTPASVTRVVSSVPPISHKSPGYWRLFNAQTIREIPFESRVQQGVLSLFWAAVMTCLLCLGTSVISPIFGEVGTVLPDAGRVGLFTLVAWLGAAGLIVISKMTEGRPHASQVRFVLQVLLGACLGLQAWWLADLLMVPIQEGHHLRDTVVRTIGRQPLLQDGAPTWLTYVLYFMALFGFRKWWWLCDGFRDTLFSIWSVVVTVLLAGVLSWMLPFPSDWGMTWAAVLACVVQLSSIWVPPEQRQPVVLTEPAGTPAAPETKVTETATAAV